MNEQNLSIEGNVDARAKAYWRKLSSEIAELALNMNARFLTIGCRDTLWGHMKSEFENSEDLSLRQFNLRSLKASPHEMLEDSHPASRSCPTKNVRPSTRSGQKIPIRELPE